MDDKKTVSDPGSPGVLMGTFLEALVHETSEPGTAGQAFVAQEKRGQRELAVSDQLPTKGLLGNDRAIWEKMGIKILEGSKDALFTLVELPPGWKKAPTDHNLWTDLVDGRGRKRGSMFYKAAFYDRDAFIHPVRRFDVVRDYDKRDVVVFQVKDGPHVVYTSTVRPNLLNERNPARDAYKRNELAEAELRKECCAWLDDNGFPNYNDPSAYWD